MVTEVKSPPVCYAAHRSGSVFAHSRQFFGNRFVYGVISPRAHGLSIGVNMNPDKLCNFNCVYCEVNKLFPPREKVLDVDLMAHELQRTLKQAESGELNLLPCYANVPSELLQLQHVALSGDGEPTMCPNFLDALRAVIHVRALGQFPFFKIVLFTNASGLDLRDVQDGLKLFTPHDEIWAKLDAGSQEYMDQVNHPDCNCSLEKILANILFTARERPVTIQSLFPMVDNQGPSDTEIERYLQRLRDLKNSGAQISVVQIYSPNRPMAHPGFGHLPLKMLAQIARRVHEVSGLHAEVF